VLGGREPAVLDLRAVDGDREDQEETAQDSEM
jgi:hypothetical protein